MLKSSFVHGRKGEMSDRTQLDQIDHTNQHSVRLCAREKIVSFVDGLRKAVERLPPSYLYCIVL